MIKKIGCAGLLLLFFLPCAMAETPESLSIDLEYAKALAEASSQELDILRAQLAAQNYAYNLGIRAFFPELSLGLSQNDTVNMNAVDSTSKSLFITLSQPIFDGGRMFFQRKIQRLSLSLEQYTYIKKREEVLDQAWQYFNNLILFQEKLKIQKTLYDISLKQLEISRKEYQVGAITEIELVDTEIEIKRLEIEIQKTKMEGDVLVYEFRRMTGISDDTPFTLSYTLDAAYKGLDIIPETQHWLLIALDLNSDIQKYQFEVAKSREELKIAEQTYLPSVEASLTLSVSGDSFPLQEPGVSFKLRFSFPFNESPVDMDMSSGITGLQTRTSGGSVQTNILPDLSYLSDKKLALLKLQTMTIQSDSMIESLRFNIEQFIKQYGFARAQLELQKEALVLLERKQRVYQSQLGIGEIKRIDYLKAQTEYYEEEIAIREQILALMEMEREFEQVLGFEPGGLAAYVKSQNAGTDKE